MSPHTVGQLKEIVKLGGIFHVGAIEILSCSTTKGWGACSPRKTLKSKVLEMAKSRTMCGYLSSFKLQISFSFYVAPPL
jgi:hypothetical protein